MAYTELTVQPVDKDGILDLDAVMVGADTQGDDGFEFDNDGNTVLVIVDTDAGDTLTLEDVADRFGRNEADLARAIAAADKAVIGPFLPEIWNQTDGMVKGKFTTHAATTTIVAVKVVKPN